MRDDEEDDRGDSLEDALERFLQEKPADVEGFLRRFPRHAEELREMLPAMRDLGAAARTLASGSLQEKLAALDLWKEARERIAAGQSVAESPAAKPPSRARRSDDFVSRVLARVETHGYPAGRFEPEGEIARGGQGAVLAVWDETLGRRLAMKVALTPAESGAAGTPSDARSLGRFLEEAQVTAQLDHPGIVPVHDLGLDPERRVYFTMKLVKGRDLRAIFGLVRDGEEGWTETRALNVLLKVCEAMSYAHSKGVIHRDLKPSNVMVGRFGEVYVMDWGLARVVGSEDRKDIRIQPELTGALHSPRHDSSDDLDSPLVTMDGDVVGTPAFMSPEQARGELEAMGPHSDVYAVGAMLYQLLTGQMPYVPYGARLSNRAVWALVQKGPPDPVHELSRRVPAELVAICDKAMSRDVASRYVDMSALAEDLRAFLEGRVVRAYEAGALAELRKWVVRNKLLAAALASVFMVVVGAMVVTLVFKTRAAERTVDVLRLSAMQDLGNLTAEAERLWPAHPENVASYREWLRKAEELVAALPEHEAKLTELRARAISLVPEEADRTEPEAQASRHPEWIFADGQERWWHDQLQKLVEGLNAFGDAAKGLLSAGVSEEHGWGVKKRLEFAATIEQQSVSGAQAAEGWAAAIASISNAAECPQYGGLRISPQLGLLPIGRDPGSGLWEFTHLQTGEPAARGRDGKLVLTGQTGLVLVLLPGGTFTMGAQRRNPGAPNHDPRAADDESPVHQVTLSPFYLSKYEMTQGQWLRFTGRNPSLYNPEFQFGGQSPTLLNPVERVSWTTCAQVLGRLGLGLPTEAQWEYAARGGTTTPWWVGDEKESLEGAANLKDSFYRKNGGPLAWVYEDWLDDGYFAHAPVGSYLANPFGLHDVHGNVWEWCQDWYADYGNRVRPGDGEREAGQSFTRAARGGSFSDDATFVRSTIRADGASPDGASNSRGVRPAKTITP